MRIPTEIVVAAAFVNDEFPTTEWETNEGIMVSRIVPKWEANAELIAKWILENRDE